MSPTVEYASGEVVESDYPNDNWEEKTFRIYMDGTVKQPNDPFGPVGEVVDVE